jgi:lysophospholipase L1-like esterase
MNFWNNTKALQLLVFLLISLNVLSILWIRKRHQVESARIQVAPVPTPPIPMKQYERLPGKFELGKDKIYHMLPHTDHEIVFLGNSLTQNFPLNELFNNPKIRNRGINGDHIEGLLIRIADITVSKPVKLFIEIGVNDLLAGRETDSILASYDRLIRTIRQQSPATILYIQSVFPIANHIIGADPGAQNMASLVTPLNAGLMKICHKYKLNYIDTWTEFQLNGQLKPEYSYEGLHLTPAGYLKWKDLIAKYVN